MNRLLSVLFLLFLSVSIAHAQLQSPEQYLGYKIGTRFTPHWKIVDYFHYVATTVPSMVKLQPYGKTNEGRPLLVAYVALPEHLSNLEAIRQNNLRLANMGDGQGSGTVSNSPAIVWLSYNVHGNEASSSEASMLTLYAMVNPANSQAKEWLKNTIVIIDPCLNPDGRDRYVSWYNSVVGEQYDPKPAAREHQEPWPGGRTNHYNFDLNRDWAWQTQLESQQRLQLYNTWFPQIHVDFHEQGYNSPYYFAPAAEPFHEVITPWQRTFQETIGHNHAKYFDKNGWLYFTKERFDLLYPSYGDTYPIYNGAIGMTYEQGGGPYGGLGILTAAGDTLTLVDRVTHHFTTSLSTVEVASANATKLLTEYQNFYNTAVSNGVGDYKTYIIKNSAEDAQRIHALLQLLQKNKIKYGTAGKQSTLHGYSYDSGKEEAVSVSAADIVIPSQQPKSTLVKVLFEPNVKLTDSVTYDITAWSLPYVYGVKAFASRDRLATDNIVQPAMVSNPATDTYGYVVPWTGVAAVKLFTQLQQKGIKLRMSEEPFTLSNQSFNRGAFIILKTSNQYYPNLWDTVRQLATANNVQLTPVATGFVEKGYDFGSGNVQPLTNRRIALLTGEGVNSIAAGEVWFFFDQVLHYPVHLIKLNDFNRTNWNDYDVIIMPDGNYRFLSDKGATDDFKNWISNGGHVVAMEGAVAQLAKQEWSLKSKKEAEEPDHKNTYADLKKYGDRMREELTTNTPGSIYKVELDNTHPLAFGYPNYYYTLKQDDHIYQFLEDGWNVGVIKKEKQLAGFVGAKLQQRMQDGLLFGVQDIGRGTVTYLADDVLFRSFWENGKLMFCNAVFLVGE